MNSSPTFLDHFCGCGSFSLGLWFEGRIQVDFDGAFCLPNEVAGATHPRTGEMLEARLRFELPSVLVRRGGDDVYSAGKRDLG
jgi:hypothetical protein